MVSKDFSKVRGESALPLLRNKILLDKSLLNFMLLGLGLSSVVGPVLVPGFLKRDNLNLMLQSGATKIYHVIHDLPVFRIKLVDINIENDFISINILYYRIFRECKSI